jgi:2-polyprenyl-6-hydroxyphenyl methylase/3-demethylubiquinone-9 3-methyltransferase
MDTQSGALSVTTEPGRQQSEQEKISFSFGQNWHDYVQRVLTPEREARAQASLKRFLETDSLTGLRFLDVGCGSGLFSLAAYRMGARQVESLDVDPFSVKCCELLRERAGNPSHWVVKHGSILDEPFLAGVEPADLVYAWGSLHHTGDMWRAIRNAGALVKPGGLFFIAIYNRVTGRGSSEYWLKKKRAYNRASGPVKRIMETLYYLRYGILPELIRFRNPAKMFREYESRRGMDYWVDIRDWLGGYPYEYAGADDMFRFCSRELNMELVNLKSTNTVGTNEFLFRKRV